MPRGALVYFADVLLYSNGDIPIAFFKAVIKAPHAFKTTLATELKQMAEILGECFGFFLCRTCYFIKNQTATTLDKSRESFL